MKYSYYLPCSPFLIAGCELAFHHKDLSLYLKSPDTLV